MRRTRHPDGQMRELSTLQYFEVPHAFSILAQRNPAHVSILAVLVWQYILALLPTQGRTKSVIYWGRLVPPTPTAAVTDIMRSTILAAFTVSKEEKRDTIPTIKQPTKPEMPIWTNRSCFRASSFSLIMKWFEDSICFFVGSAEIQHHGFNIRHKKPNYHPSCEEPMKCLVWSICLGVITMSNHEYFKWMPVQRNWTR